MIIRKSREIRRLQKLLETRIEYRVGGVSVLGPLTLEHLALIIKYGGYQPGADLISDGMSSGDACLLVNP